MIRRLSALLCLLLLALAAPAAAQSFPKLDGRVVDAAGLLDPAQQAELTQLSGDIERASSRQFVVATVPSLEGREIEDYGYRLGREWKIGQEGANNGIILLVAPNERKVRIEVGYGLEPVMTDALSSLIIQNDILPRFRDGDMAGGIMAGARAIGEQMKLPLEAAEQRAQAQLSAKRSKRSSDVNWPLIIFWGVVIVFFVLPAIFGSGRRGKKYRRGGGPVVIWGGSDWGSGGSSSGGGSSWGGSSGSSWGGGGGGGFSGGGGSFGGGGASGSW